MFTYSASPVSRGNENVRRVCKNSSCGGEFFITYGAQSYRCPHCNFTQ